MRQQLTRNRTDLTHTGVQDTPRQGAALLQGLLPCGRCGQRMTVRYHGQNGRRASYQYDRRPLYDGQGGMCWSMAASSLDTAVATHALATHTAANLDLALAALTQLEDARYEAQRAAC